MAHSSPAPNAVSPHSMGFSQSSPLPPEPAQLPSPLPPTAVTIETLARWKIEAKEPKSLNDISQDAIPLIMTHLCHNSLYAFCMVSKGTRKTIECALRQKLSSLYSDKTAQEFLPAEMKAPDEGLLNLNLSRLVARLEALADGVRSCSTKGSSLPAFEPVFHTFLSSPQATVFNEERFFAFSKIVKAHALILNVTESGARMLDNDADPSSSTDPRRRYRPSTKIYDKIKSTRELTEPELLDLGKKALSWIEKNGHEISALFGQQFVPEEVIQHCSGVQKLVMTGQENFKFVFPFNIAVFKELNFLGLSEASPTFRVPREVGSLPNLENLFLCRCPGVDSLPKELRTVRNGEVNVFLRGGCPLSEKVKALEIKVKDIPPEYFY